MNNLYIDGIKSKVKKMPYQSHNDEKKIPSFF